MTTKLLGQYTTAHSVCREAWSFTVRAVYEHAIEITTAPRGLLGWSVLLPLIFLTVFGCIALLSVPLLAELLREGGRAFFVTLLLLPFLVLSWVATAWFGVNLWLTLWRRPFDLPQIYNRRNGTVYLFEEAPSRTLSVRRMFDLLNAEKRKHWFGPRALTVRVLPWSGLMVEDYEVTERLPKGGTITRRQLALTFEVDAQGDASMRKPGFELRRFNVGEAGDYTGPLTRAEEWEHVRRYMRLEGSALAVGHALAEPRRALNWWGHLGVSSAFGPGYLGFWREHPVLSGFIHLLLPLTLPLALLTTTLGWLSDLAAHEVAWPDWVLQEAGPVIENP